MEVMEQYEANCPQVAALKLMLAQHYRMESWERVRPAAYDCGIRTGDTVLEVANVKITHPLQIYSVLSKQESNGYAEIKVLRDEKVSLCTMVLSD